MVAKFRAVHLNVSIITYCFLIRYNLHKPKSEKIYDVFS